MNLHTTRRIPALLLAAAALNFAWMGWLWWHGFPRSTADIVCFKQPSYMRLFTPHFSVPTYGGDVPLVETLNSYPTVVFYYVNYVAFRLFGFSLYTSLAVDLAIHVLLVMLVALWLWKMTGRELPAVVFLIASSQFLIPIGRPEELGMLLALVGLLVLERGTLGLAIGIVALGLTGVTTPGAAIVGTTLFVAYDGFRREFRGAFWRRAAAIVLLAPLVSIAVYAWYAYPHYAEAWAQDQHLRKTQIYTTSPFLKMVTGNLRWSLVTFPIVGLSLVLGCYCLFRKPSWYPRLTPGGAFVAAAVPALIVGFLLNLMVDRLHYDYRHLTALSLAVVLLVSTWWPAGERRLAPGTIAVMAGVLLLCLIADFELFRYTLAPFTRDPRRVTYEQAYERVHSVLPSTGSVGGDGSAWTVITDGRPFITTRLVDRKDWPDYLVCSAWAKIPTMVQEDPDIMAEDYVEITPEPLMPVDGDSVDIFGWQLPIATGRSDWYMRVWKRKDLVEPKASQPPASAPSPPAP